MKKLKLIYNPFSGNKNFKNALDDAVSVFQQGGYETHLFRSCSRGDIKEHIESLPHDYYDAVVVSGGDGTLNIAVNALIDSGHDIPVGIIPSGTANDFASFLQIPQSVPEAAKIITDGNIMPCDVGRVNDKYFINVCSAGILTNISQQIDDDFKNSLGKLAYYLEGLGQIPNFVPLPMRITNSRESFVEDLYLFIVLNSSGTGGFERLSPNAQVNDGLFDFIALKAKPMMEIAVLLVKILKRDFLEDSNIVYFQDRYIKIEPLFDKNLFFETDIDGEPGPAMPIEIINVPNTIQIFVPKNI